MGHSATPICWHARSSMSHSGLFLEMSATLSCCSICMLCPLRPSFTSPALSLFTMSFTSAVL